MAANRVLVRAIKDLLLDYARSPSLTNCEIFELFVLLKPFMDRRAGASDGHLAWAGRSVVARQILTEVLAAHRTIHWPLRLLFLKREEGCVAVAHR